MNVAEEKPNKWVKFARCACPTRKGEAPLLAAYPQRWAK